MPAHHDHEARLEQLAASRAARGLIDDACFAPQGGCQFLQSLFLKYYEAIRDVQRCTCGRVASDVAVKVGAREHDHQRPRRICKFESLRRVVAAPRVERDHEVGGRTVPRLRYGDAMTEPAQQRRPARGSMTVAVAAARRCRRDDRDFHDVVYPR